MSASSGLAYQCVKDDGREAPFGLYVRVATTFPNLFAYVGVSASSPALLLFSLFSPACSGRYPLFGWYSTASALGLRKNNITEDSFPH